MLLGGPALGQEVQGEEAAQAVAILEDASKGKGLQFSDKDEHMYFWFPLLAGLSELTFDPRPDIRYSALEVMLLPIFKIGTLHIVSRGKTIALSG